MAVPSDIGAAPRIRIPSVLVRAASTTSKIELRLDGAVVQPSACTYTLTSPTGTTLVDAQAATVAASGCTYDVQAADVPATLDMGEGYREVWTATISGVAHTFTRPAILTRYPFRCPVTQADLVAEYPDLPDQLRSADTSTLQPFIDAAYTDVVRDLVRSGRLPEHMVDSDAFHDVIRELALHKVFRAYSMRERDGGSFSRLSDEHGGNYRRAYANARSRLDADQDGHADNGDRQAATFVIHRNGSPARRWPYARGKSVL